MTVGGKRRRQWLHRWVWVLFDGAIWFVAMYCATWLRIDINNTSVIVGATLAFASVTALAHLLVGGLIGPYAVGHRRDLFEETTDLGRTVLVTVVGLLVWAVWADPLVVPRSVPVVAGALALVGMFATRFIVRSWREDLFSKYENRRTTSNPLINSVQVPTLRIDEVLSAEMENHKAAAAWIRQLSAPSVKSGV